MIKTLSFAKNMNILYSQRILLKQINDIKYGQSILYIIIYVAGYMCLLYVCYIKYVSSKIGSKHSLLCMLQPK